MSIYTKIHWCDSTVNPTMGCDGCELWCETNKTCYAGILHDRFGGHTTGYASSFDQVTLFPGRMAKAAAWSDLRGQDRPNKPWLTGCPRMIFISDMTDSFSHVVTFEYLRDEVINNVITEKGKRHRWLWLTKRPKRMAEFSSWLINQGINWPEHLWAGTSVTVQKTTNRIADLLQVGDSSTVRFLSIEPQIEEIDLNNYLPMIDWAIQGGESGRGARPFDIEWANNLRRACQERQVAYFLKQLGSNIRRHGERVKFVDSHAADWTEWPPELAVREVP